MAPSVFSPEVAAASSRAVAWLREVAWPFWLARGIDRDLSGRAVGFHEHLTLDRHDCAAEFRRLRVVTRQTYVFSEAASAGLPGAAEAVMLGLDYLRRHAFDPGGGYRWRFDLSGCVVDARRDLYDHAFVLLALASAMRVLPSPDLAAEARALDAYLHDVFPHQAGGYGESLPPSLPRRQNPHMHLLEACLAASEVFGDDPFLDRADGLVDLFLTRMFQPAEGALPEYFDEALVPHREAGRFVVEPGHHCEWVWLLDWHARRRAEAGRPRVPNADAASLQLARFVDRHGVHPQTGALSDEVWSDGTPRALGQRLWPQTERLKSELLRPDANSDRVLHAFAVLDSYILPAPPGLWLERRTAAGDFTRDAAPASSLYHLTQSITFTNQLLTANSELGSRG
ncbi:AGE family epimerase/isomerase [Acidisoma sp.]|uniref:AGE family epimerase/isomerase n=1 Tax=Acidisoma sp. TaxID=1872115 RepID=UPI003B002F04